MDSSTGLTIHVVVQDAGAVVMKLSGNLDAESSPGSLPRILDALDQSQTGAIMDFAGVKFISSAGLGVLVETQRRAQAAAKQLALVHLPPQLYKIFKVSRLDQVFRLCQDENDAIQALRPPPQS
ncbi:MAG: Anti-sigma-B factor antagonist [Planctomycetes bacterium ADurb.Bin126]|nr:MAG: Anti-sigma-B factor antagonist [Planctomycetes bacterium ADurb.Bin126]HOD81833.1 STAS domain-containing protein [Phycisphaerae bacterium]HQL75644.1 STAS domain-containing protein [Phycisphaerae bacterium]